ncbi:hypothetical protein BMT55_15770 [Listeria newyorkensis]|uniref:Gp28/Gp37-like domain-containing protein n=1 Tax=Listeria newyorkensis TaxID=1497681 RepID=A0ABX4XK81_9LIST|nr:siphovirus ReqiPepy6 Gp37-like family protein [Listeria newyorkensis]PNP88218.1 hypothetical protein BMT55_15770 [Listeria newyorkensis]
MDVRAEIKVYSPDLKWLAEIDAYESLEFEACFYEIGSFELHIKIDSPGTEFLIEDNLIIIAGDNKKCGEINTRIVSHDDDGVEKWVISGRTLNGRTDSRVTYPPLTGEEDEEGLLYDEITDTASNVMHHLIDKNMINADDKNRNINQFILPDKKSLGPVIYKKTRYKKLDEELLSIAETNGVGWRCFIDFKSGKRLFDFYVGTDRSIAQNVNKPIVFSDERDNISSFDYTSSSAEYKNYAIVAGEGEAEEREFIFISNTSDITGLSRREIFIDARDVQTDEDAEEDEEATGANGETLEQRGQRKLFENSKINKLVAEVFDVEGYRYNADYFLGDIVTVQKKSWGVTMNTPITKITEVWDHTGYTVTPLFGKDQATLTEKIKAKFNERDEVIR